MSEDNSAADPIELATELTIAWLSNPNTRADPSEAPEFLRAMHAAVGSLGSPEASEKTNSEYVPAVTARRSLSSPDHIISMIDGKAYKTLRRHLTTQGLTPQDYRQRYGLKADYPMVAPTYAEMRREMAKRIGLGRKRNQTAKIMEGGESSPSPTRRARTPKKPAAEG